MLRLEDIMSSPLLTVTPDLSLRAAAELLSMHHVSGAPVVRGSEVIGVITSGDILNFQATREDVLLHDAPRAEEADWSEVEEVESGLPWDEWEEGPLTIVERLADAPLDEDELCASTVDEAMTREVLSLPATCSVRDGAAFIARHAIHRVLVERDGEIVGVVSTSDLARILAERGLAEEGEG